MTYLRREQISKCLELYEYLGEPLFTALMRVADLHRAAAMNDRSAKRQLSQIRAYLGPTYWDYLSVVIKTGSMFVGGRGDPEAKRKRRDAIVLVHEWAEDRKRWGMDWTDC